MEQSVPKRRHIKFRRRGITQKKANSIQNRTKVWNQEFSKQRFAIPLNVYRPSTYPVHHTQLHAHTQLFPNTPHTTACTNPTLPQYTTHNCMHTPNSSPIHHTQLCTHPTLPQYTTHNCMHTPNTSPVHHAQRCTHPTLPQYTTHN